MTTTHALFAILFTGARLGFGAPPGGCTSATGIVTSRNAVLLHCTTDWPGTPVFAELWRVPPDWNKDPRQRGTRLTVAAGITETRPPDNAYRLITFDRELEPGVAYDLLLSTPAAQTTDPRLSVLFSTMPEAAIERDKIGSHWGSIFEVRSPVALSPTLSPPANRTFIELVRSTEIPHHTCILILYEERNTPDTPCTPRPADPPLLANAGVARVTLLNDTLTQARVGARVTGLTNIFGEAVKVQTKPDKPIDLTAPPASKDAAKWYLKFGYQKVAGSPHSLALDLKVNPVLTHAGPFDVQPDIVVDIAENEAASANPRSSDTIRFGGSLYYLRMRNPANHPFLAGIDFRPGASLETDREVSHKNLLGSAETQLYLRGLYNTTEMQTQREAARSHRNFNEVPPARFGYAIGIYAGLEAGRSVVEQTFQNQAGTASIGIPTYSIARFWPRVRQTYELDRVTVDINATLRYLGQAEAVGHENPDGSVNFKPVRGWRFYDEASISIALDRGKHANFVVTWKRGAKPPNWADTNAVITGFAFSY